MNNVLAGLEGRVFKVIAIPSNYSLVLNCGARDHAQIGDIFEIYVPGPQMFDPDSNEKLGSLDYIKESVEIVMIYEKMCKCEGIVYNSAINSMISALSFVNTTRSELNVNENEIGINIGDVDESISIGDLARFQRHRISQEDKLPSIEPGK